MQSFVNRKNFMQTVLTLFLWSILRTAVVSPVDHPFHVSVTEINHNMADKTLEVQCKFFTDDLEATLAGVYSTKADLSAAAMHVAMDSLLGRYVPTRLQLTVNGRPVRMNYLGFEQEKESVYVFLEVPNMTALQELGIKATFLYEKFTDQINIFHVKTAGEQKSTKLDHPASAATLQFR